MEREALCLGKTEKINVTLPNASIRKIEAKPKNRPRFLAEAAKRVIAWQVQQIIESQNITKAQLARDLETSRGAVDRILDAQNTCMTLKSLGAIADLFGKRLEINLVDA